LPEENDLEGHQDQGGKHGGQAGMPKPIPRPKATERDEDVIRKGSKQALIGVVRLHESAEAPTSSCRSDTAS
jgi:hypothetical protein